MRPAVTERNFMSTTTYIIKKISSREDLVSCPLFEVAQFNWGGYYRPHTYGQFAFLDGEGFLLHMTCEESNPVCHYHHNFEPVWMDSAMEGFFCFDCQNDNYINLEINSAGALVASFGSGKTGRINLTETDIRTLDFRAVKNTDTWCIDVFIPLSLIETYFHISSYQSGDCIPLNFFKLAEGTESTHFASFAPIDSPEPNFHLSQFFAQGIIED